MLKGLLTMRLIFSIVCSLCFSIQLIAAEEVKIPRVPSDITIAGMKLKITEGARREIQKDVDALRSYPKYFNIKLDRARLYFPIIEKIFKEEGVPDDFKYLAVQESALISDAVSSADAVGFWQFKDFTGREVGLRIDRNVDERLNVVSSTYGVSKYFKRHNFYFKNWIYTILAHMTGRGGAMKHVDKRQFGVKKMTIDKNAHWYVKRYIAHVIAFKDVLDGKHSQGLNLLTYEKGEGKDLESIAKDFKVEYEQVKKYNKWLKKGKVPSEKVYTVLIPTTKRIKTPTEKTNPKERIKAPILTIKTYPNLNKKFNTSKTIFIKINGIQSILAKRTDTSDSLARKGKISLNRFLKNNDMKPQDRIKEGEIYYLKSKRNKANVYFYTVTQKESMWEVSQKFGIKVKKLAKLNRMLTIDEPQIGRVLYLREKMSKDAPVIVKEVPKRKKTKAKIPEVIPVPVIPILVVPAIVEVSEPVIEENVAQSKVHIVVEGETLYGISRIYNISVESIKSWNELASNALKLGQKLTVAPNSTSETSPEDVVNKEEVVNKTDKVKSIIHKVESGETLYGISRKYAVDVDEIVNWNNLKSTSLSLGQKLTIHNTDHEIESDNKKPKTKVTVHVVEPGDTFYGISIKYNIGVTELQELNNKDNFNLEIGEKLIVGK
jgi:membrane-bound lytic murein transglycosylase D